MKGFIFRRHEVVFYVLGVRDASVLEDGLAGKELNYLPRNKAVVYMERVAQAQLHRGDQITIARERAKTRAIELEGIE